MPIELDTDIEQLIREHTEEFIGIELDEIYENSIEPNISEFISRGEFEFNGIKHSFDVGNITDFIPKIQLTDNFELSNFLDNPTASLPLIKNDIISNVQNLAFDNAEKLLGEFGSNFGILSGLVCNGVPNLSGHNSGNSIDITLGGFGTNLFSYVEDIEKLLKGKISQIGLIYDTSSWIHISTLDSNISDITNPLRYTLDKTTGEVIKGEFSPIRGIF